jgi:hypothetical protein
MSSHNVRLCDGSTDFEELTFVGRRPQNRHCLTTVAPRRRSARGSHGGCQECRRRVVRRLLVLRVEGACLLLSSKASHFASAASLARQLCVATGGCPTPLQPPPLAEQTCARVCLAPALLPRARAVSRQTSASPLQQRGAKAKATQAHLGEELSFYYNEEVCVRDDVASLFACFPVGGGSLLHTCRVPLPRSPVLDTPT